MTNLFGKTINQYFKTQFSKFHPWLSLIYFDSLYPLFLLGILPLQLLILLLKTMKIWQQLFKLVKTPPLVGDMNPTSVDNDNLGDG